MAEKERAPLNRTITVSPNEYGTYKQRLIELSRPACEEDIENRVINRDLLDVVNFLPDRFVDLLFLDPPYNLDKSWNGVSFRQRSPDEYEGWMQSWLTGLIRTLKPTASIYICGDWQSSGAIQRVAQRHFVVRNRITWEREKGRGAKTNWKNTSEDIWFCTMSGEYVFNATAVKLKRRVLAPYRDDKGNPKDWNHVRGQRYRLTHPSNVWTDTTVPFWSMRENTDHPTQKPEKLLAKIILASSAPGDMVFDPFAGSGTTCVVAKKLGRRYVGVEVD